MAGRQATIAALVAIHLILTAVFVWTNFPGDRPGVMYNGLRTYRNLAGIFRDYTFFAPAVASDVKAGFVVETADGESSFLSFAAKNREIGFRYNCIVASCLRDRAARDLFAQSWAATVLGSEPRAGRVTVVAMTYVVPSMEDYRGGQRPQWVPVYAGEFARSDDGAPPVPRPPESR